MAMKSKTPHPAIARLWSAHTRPPLSWNKIAVARIVCPDVHEQLISPYKPRQKHKPTAYEPRRTVRQQPVSAPSTYVPVLSESRNYIEWQRTNKAFSLLGKQPLNA